MKTTTIARMRRVFVTAGLALAMIGCSLGRRSIDRESLLRPNSSAASARSRAAGERKDAAIRKTNPADDTNVLSTVADFLERTSQYQLSSASMSVPTAATTMPLPASDQASAPVSRPRVTPAFPAGGLGSEPVRLECDGQRLRSAHRNVFTNTQVEIPEPVIERPGVAVPVVESVSVRVPTDLPHVAPEPTSQQTSNKPLTVASTPEPLAVDDVLARLKAKASADPNFESEWPLRMAQLAFHRDGDAVRLSSELPQTARDLMAALVRTALTVRRVIREPAAAGREALVRVDHLRRLLAERADPLVADVALCRRVVTFGVYDEMSEADFVAGAPIHTIVYSEIENLKPDVTKDGRYRSRLGTRLELLTEDGQSVWEHEEPEIVDICRRPRTDFFIAQRIALPPTLAPGRYVLKVFVEDKIAGRADEAAHPFEIRASAPTPTRVTSRG